MAVRPGSGSALAALSFAFGIALATLCQTGCARDPLDAACAGMASGDLVVSELRGAQTGPDGYGEWIELYNASGGDLDLQGVTVALTTLNGSSTADIVVRNSILVPADGFAVLGRFAPGDEPDYVDLGFADQFDKDLYDAGAVTVSACGSTLDRIIYRSLPDAGTHSLSGDIFPPDATTNDTESDWCADTAEDQSSAQLGIRGTPGERNRPCS